ncbi:MAG: hypothetical protein MSH64_05910 [Bacteroides uniformis]|nr:hypothetical protein [Bacteroides uniformis]
MQQKKEGCGTEENTGESKIYPHPFRLLSPTPAMPMNREVEEKSESGEGRNANLKRKSRIIFRALLSHFDGLVVSSHDGESSKRTAAL